MHLLRYSVRALLVAITVVSVFFAFARTRMARDREAQAIVERLHCNRFDGGRFPKIAYWLPGPFTHVLWPPYLNVNITFGLSPSSYGIKLHDADLCALASLRHLHVLWIHHANENVDPAHPLTDDGIACLGQCRELALLAIESPAMTDAAFATFGEIKTLTVLEISGARVTGTGLGHLEKLPALITLDLRDTQISDGAIERLAMLKQVRILFVGGTRITPTGCDRLRALLPDTFVLGPRVVPVVDLEVPAAAAPYLVSPYYP
jgi:hypothetical protein